MATRIGDAAARAGTGFVRVDEPSALPAPGTVRIVLVDWAERGARWADTLTRWRDGGGDGARPRIILFGPHTDLEAHAAARASRLGPMWARSKLLSELSSLLA